MDKWILSVVIPVYNCEKVLRRCVEYLSPKQYPMEVILVNDGSKDHSLAVCREMEQRYANVHVIDKPNGGVSSARNIGMKAAMGEWVTFIDADDFLHPSIFENLFLYLNQKNAELIHYGCVEDHIIDGKLNDQKIRSMPLVDDYEMPYQKYDIQQHFGDLFKNNVFDSACGKFYKKRVIDCFEITFREDMTVREDSEFVLNYASHIHEITVIKEYPYHYQICGKDTYFHRRPLDLDDVKKLEQRYLAIFSEKKIAMEEYEMVNRHLYQTIFGGVINKSSRKYNPSFYMLYQYIRRCGEYFPHILREVQYTNGFHHYLIRMLRNRCYFLASFLCRLRFGNMGKKEG